MANRTIYPNAIDDLSWSSSGQDTAETTAENTVVLNSSGARVYWTEGANSGSFTNTKTLTCIQAATTKIWGFSDESSGAAKITLTVTGSGGGGGGAPPACTRRYPPAVVLCPE
jgi:hypothetical protein